MNPNRSSMPRKVFFFLAATLLAVTLTSFARRARPGQSGSVAKTSAAALRLNTLGVAFMNQQKSAEAQKQFEQALALDPEFAQARLNLGISLLAQQKLDEGRAALQAAANKLPNDPFAWYNLGIACKDLGDQEAGIAAFRHVTQIVPDEPDAYYFIGFLQAQLQKYDDAVASFQKAIALAPYHASAQFGLARAFQRKGDAESAREAMKRFQKLTAEKLGVPFGAGYGDQGKFSLAEFVHGADAAAPPESPVRFAGESLAKLVPGAAAARGVCLFDYDADGKPDLFLVAADSGQSKLLHNLGGKFEDVTSSSGLSGVGPGFGCAAGDFDNDGQPDLAIAEASGIRLFHNDGAGKFSDVTQKSGLARDPGVFALAFVDFDHDGDLDLYLTFAPAASGSTARANRLWRNNGNSTFTDYSAESGLGIPASSGGVTFTDFNNDRAVDFVIPGGPAGVSIFLNPREGKFTPLAGPDFAALHLPPAIGVAVLDFDKDGWMDLAFTHSGAPGLTLWRNVQGKSLERVALPDLGLQQAAGLAAFDFDNDGWVDLVVAGESSAGGQLRLLRNLGEAGWADVTSKSQLDAVKLDRPRAIAIADFAGKGAASLLVTQESGAPVLFTSPGVPANNWTLVQLKGLNDNRSGYGTKVELFAGPLYQKWEVTGSAGYLGQSAIPLLAGLGPQKTIDAVRLLWPTGVPQDEVDLPAGKLQLVAELDRRGSSCPILFAWNGAQYEFIADMIGPGVVGHWVGPHERSVADPDEYLKVPARSVRPKNGLLSFRFLEPMEETVYLDQVRLLAIDHPAGVEVNPNERFVSNPPFPEFRVVASSNTRLPLAAVDDHGRNVLPLLAKSDRRYVADLPDSPFTGFSQLHWIELDLGPLDTAKPLRLLLNGYTDYFTATSMYAADQAGVKVIAPYVEAQDAAGNWTRVVDDMGFPAGLYRTMVADLSGKLPHGTRRIRIVTNLKIYWDSARVDQTPDRSDLRVAEVPLASATLAALGYPRELRLHPASDTAYSYSRLSPTGPYARAAGNYTRFGDVKSLLSSADDKFTIFSSGEGLKLDFDPHALPPLPAGWVRDYFFYANGFEKDMDFYAAHAFTVEPLPTHTLVPYPYPGAPGYPSDDDHLLYQLEYNTRSRSGQLPSSLRYDYSAPPMR